jgi:hypothetical protein
VLAVNIKIIRDLKHELSFFQPGYHAGEALVCPYKFHFGVSLFSQYGLLDKFVCN